MIEVICDSSNRKLIGGRTILTAVSVPAGGPFVPRMQTLGFRREHGFGKKSWLWTHVDMSSAPVSAPMSCVVQEG